ncbi:MAG: GNAT family N-acetyltransferase [Mesorhizobium sp.]|nr:MAG: GNAT family N-acetyltransferase [Mesorhizobium sp.]TIW29408.1 MAG: GNAT family N-acetyltransferase [Mesorhizobium sp.]
MVEAGGGFSLQIEIDEVIAITPAVAEAFAELVRQLSSSARMPSKGELEEIVASPATIVLAARASEKIVGMLTLVVFRIPTGVRGIIEDVVVDEAYRGQGIAEALTREALARSGAAGARTVDLTSRPSREAANRLYQRLGFQKRDSNVYRFSLGKEGQ